MLGLFAAPQGAEQLVLMTLHLWCGPEAEPLMLIMLGGFVAPANSQTADADDAWCVCSGGDTHKLQSSCC